MLNGNGHSPQRLHKNAFKVMSGTVPFEGQVLETHAVSFVGTPAMFPEPVRTKNWLMARSSAQKEESLLTLKDILIASPSMAPEAVTPRAHPASLGLTPVPYVVATMPCRLAERSAFLVIKTPLLSDQWEVTLAAVGLLYSFADVVQGIRTGFNFRVPVHIENTYIPKNHSSAHANPSVIIQYI